ncbi:MAG TPA: signal peptidase I [Pirellulales bacterium]|nr:signal peptidase I [Pirellulales bacterium]
MSTIAPSPASQTDVSDSTAEKRLRTRARRRAMFCPGAGWALVGYRGRGAMVLASFIVGWASLVWMLWTLSPASVWAAGATMLATVVLWSIEALDVGWCVVRAAGENWLGRRFAITTFVVIVMVLEVPLVILSRCGSIAVGDERMAPTLDAGERLIYHRSVAGRDLHEGAVVLYRVSSESKVGTTGALSIARILAAPGDKLAVGRDHFIVNGEVSRYRAIPAPKAPLKIPARPESLTVPDDSYFVALDSSSADIDGQQIGWVRRSDIISTRLFHFGDRGVMRPVK